jgi:hypothetical protein
VHGGFRSQQCRPPYFGCRKTTVCTPGATGQMNRVLSAQVIRAARLYHRAESRLPPSVRTKTRGQRQHPHGAVVCGMLWELPCGLCVPRRHRTACALPFWALQYCVEGTPVATREPLQLLKPHNCLSHCAMHCAFLPFSEGFPAAQPVPTASVTTDARHSPRGVHPDARGLREPRWVDDSRKVCSGKLCQPWGERALHTVPGWYAPGC